MEILVLGRLLQGLGGGGSIVAVYVLVGVVYPAWLQPRVFASFAAAWVLPSLFGPAIAALIAARYGWQWVFLTAVGVAGVALLMCLPALRSLPDQVARESGERAARIGVVGAGRGRRACSRPVLTGRRGIGARGTARRRPHRRRSEAVGAGGDTAGSARSAEHGAHARRAVGMLRGGRGVRALRAAGPVGLHCWPGRRCADDGGDLLGDSKSGSRTLGERLADTRAMMIGSQLATAGLLCIVLTTSADGRVCC